MLSSSPSSPAAAGAATEFLRELNERERALIEVRIDKNVSDCVVDCRYLLER
jgi:hypothetical protein